jgi:hypothetical protein
MGTNGGLIETHQKLTKDKHMTEKNTARRPRQVTTRIKVCFKTVLGLVILYYGAALSKNKQPIDFIYIFTKTRGF